MSLLRPILRMHSRRMRPISTVRSSPGVRGTFLESSMVITSTLAAWPLRWMVYFTNW